MNYTIAEEYTLPSKGKVYSKEINPSVNLRSMTTEDEMKMLSPSDKQYKVMSDVIEGCMVEKPEIHVYDMCEGDYKYLLHKLRVVTYGKDYKMSVRCPYCGKLINTTINLDELKVREFDESVSSLLKIHLPRTGADVEINMMTPRMRDNMEARRREMNKKGSGQEYSMLIFLDTVIASVNGEQLGAVEKEKFIRKLPMLDANFIKKTAEKLNLSIGVDDSIKVSCDGCGREFDSLFRYTSEFFEPDID